MCHFNLPAFPKLEEKTPTEMVNIFYENIKVKKISIQDFDFVENTLRSGYNLESIWDTNGGSSFDKKTGKVISTEKFFQIKVEFNHPYQKNLFLIINYETPTAQ